MKDTASNRFPRTRGGIVIGSSGWGDLLLGVVVGGLKLSSGRYMARRIPVRFFQPPLFRRKLYLGKAVKIVHEMIDVMRADRFTRIEVSSGHILSLARAYLKHNGYNLRKGRAAGKFQEMVERSYVRWGLEKGIPARALHPESPRKRFMASLQWVSKDPNVRERLVKTGWRSWHKRWRRIAYSQAHRHSVTNKIRL